MNENEFNETGSHESADNLNDTVRENSERLNTSDSEADSRRETDSAETASPESRRDGQRELMEEYRQSKGLSEEDAKGDKVYCALQSRYEEFDSQCESDEAEEAAETPPGGETDESDSMADETEEGDSVDLWNPDQDKTSDEWQDAALEQYGRNQDAIDEKQARFEEADEKRKAQHEAIEAYREEKGNGLSSGERDRVYDSLTEHYRDLDYECQSLGKEISDLRDRNDLLEDDLDPDRLEAYQESRQKELDEESGEDGENTEDPTDTPDGTEPSADTLEDTDPSADTSEDTEPSADTPDSTEPPDANEDGMGDGVNNGDQTENPPDTDGVSDDPDTDEIADDPDTDAVEEYTDGDRPEPNSIITTPEGRFRIDDNGNPHMYYDNENKQWKLIPNNSYDSNGYHYETDENGRITHVEGNLRLNPDGRQPLNAKLEDMKPGDERGHIIADVFCGSNQIDNLVPQTFEVNRGEYKAMENDIHAFLKEGQEHPELNREVRAEYEMIYSDDTKRPEGLCVHIVMYENGKDVCESDKFFCNQKT